MTDAGSDPPEDRSDRDDGDDGRSRTDRQDPDERTTPNGETSSENEAFPTEDEETATESEESPTDGEETATESEEFPTADEEIATESEGSAREPASGSHGEPDQDVPIGDENEPNSSHGDGLGSAASRGNDSDSVHAANADTGTLNDRASSDGTARGGRTPLAGESDPVTISSDGVLRWFLRSEDTVVAWIRDLVVSVGIVALIALILFGMSGVWPPLVAVESGSMEPGMQRGDMIFVVEPDRFVSDGAIGDTGVVTYENGSEHGHSAFGNPGDVIIFRPDGSETATPVIHRAHYWVEEGENWVDERADDRLTNGNSCDAVDACPAPHDGFITHGDANGAYDQIGQTDGADTTVVEPEWIEGKAHYRIPLLGHIRLTLDDVLATPDAGSVTDGSVSIADGAVSIADRGWSIVVGTGPITDGSGPISVGTGQVVDASGPIAAGSGLIADGGDAADRAVASLRDVLT